MATLTRIRRVSPLQAGKVAGMVYAGMSLIFVPIFAIFMGFGALASFAAASASNHHAAAALPAALGVGMFIAGIIFVPIIYGVMGFIIGALGALLYNLVAKWVGGIEIELE